MKCAEPIQAPQTCVRGASFQPLRKELQCGTRKSFRSNTGPADCTETGIELTVPLGGLSASGPADCTFSNDLGGTKELVEHPRPKLRWDQLSSPDWEQRKDLWSRPPCKLTADTSQASTVDYDALSCFQPIHTVGGSRAFSGAILLSRSYPTFQELSDRLRCNFPGLRKRSSPRNAHSLKPNPLYYKPTFRWR